MGRRRKQRRRMRKRMMKTKTTQRKRKLMVRRKRRSSEERRKFCATPCFEHFYALYIAWGATRWHECSELPRKTLSGWFHAVSVGWPPVAPPSAEGRWLPKTNSCRDWPWCG